MMAAKDKVPGNKYVLARKMPLAAAGAGSSKNIPQLKFAGGAPITAAANATNAIAGRRYE